MELIYQIYQSENIVHLHLQLTKILPNVPQMARKHSPDLKCILLIPKIKQCLDWNVFFLFYFLLLFNDSSLFKYIFKSMQSLFLKDKCLATQDDRNVLL